MKKQLKFIVNVLLGVSIGFALFMVVHAVLLTYINSMFILAEHSLRSDPEKLRMIFKYMEILMRIFIFAVVYIYAYYLFRTLFKKKPKVKKDDNKSAEN